MKHIYLLPAILALISFTLPAWAVDIYQCQDSQGHRTFEAHCPPGTKPVSQKNYRTGEPKTPAENNGNNQSLSGVLYVVPDCSSCDQVKDFLKLRHISYTEKNVKNDVKLQAELKKISGELRVPTLVIGKQVVTGSSRDELLKALAKAGYKAPTAGQEENGNADNGNSSNQ